MAPSPEAERPCEQSKPGQSILRRTGACAVCLLILGVTTVLGRPRPEQELEADYTNASFHRRTTGPDGREARFEISKEVWDEARAQLRVNLLKNEEIRVKAVTERRLKAEEEARKELEKQEGAPDRALFNLFDWVGDGGKPKSEADLMKEQEAERLKEDQDSHKDKQEANAGGDMDNSDLFKLLHQADTFNAKLEGHDSEEDDEDHKGGEVNANAEQDFNEKTEAAKAAMDQMSKEHTKTQDMKAKFEEMEEKAKAKAKKAKEEFEKKQKKRQEELAKKAKAEKAKLEREMKFKNLQQKKVMLQEKLSQAMQEERNIRKTVSLYCCALMMPFGYEAGLLLAQKEQGVGIFQCDAWTVYSNQSKMANGDDFPFPVHEVRSPEGKGISLFVPLGGKWHTALNRDVFNQLWLEVLKVDEYRKHDWTVKVDPDSVFFPRRLQDVIARRAPLNTVHRNGPEPDKLDCGYCKKEGYTDQTCASHVHWMQHSGSTCDQALRSVSRAPEVDCGCQCDDFSCSMPTSQAMYINNCQWGLHGPIEVFSRRAIALYIAGLPICANLLPHAWGEDKFIDQCMIELGLTRVDTFDIMSEIACGDQPAPCGQTDTTFHPFKNVEKWFACWNFATKYGHGPEDQLAAIRMEMESVKEQLAQEEAAHAGNA